MKLFEDRQFGLIWFPSMRGVAYLDVMRESKILPSVIMVLKNEFSFIDGLAEEDKQNGYSEQYFNLKYTIECFANEFDIPIIISSANNINDDSVIKLLNQQTIVNWLFTGGGILKEKLFENGRKYLHIHPGKLPYYRGSTCFYYSLLNDASLAASAFFLTPALDNGATLVSCDFKVNIKIDTNHRYFMDYILDPWIRAQTLKKVLTYNFVDALPNEASITRHNTGEVDRTYYVMHPLLRALTINKVNQAFNTHKPTGIFLIE